MRARHLGGIFVHEAAHCQARCAPGDAALRASDQLRIWRMDSNCSRLQATVFPHSSGPACVFLLLPSPISWLNGAGSYLTSVLVGQSG